ncbi:hypothetical protein [Sporosarcina sp. UB5]|uniref:hypothetical protein n=1 Tax=Sporosarcina sp. UB5 TaxID=3047463 RepID=UPI003D7968AA
MDAYRSALDAHVAILDAYRSALDAHAVILDAYRSALDAQTLPFLISLQYNQLHT